MNAPLVDKKFDIKKSSNSLLLFTLRVLVGLSVGLILSLIGKGLFEYGDVTVTFITVSFCLLFLRASSKWTYIGLGIFSLICVLVGILLKMYIRLAPGV